MTAEYVCTRKQFNRNLSEFGLIQVVTVVHYYICWISLYKHYMCALGFCTDDSCAVPGEEEKALFICLFVCLCKFVFYC